MSSGSGRERRVTGAYIGRLVVFSALGLALVSVGVVIGLGFSRLWIRRTPVDAPPDIGLVRELSAHLLGSVRMAMLVWERGGDRRIHALSCDIAVSGSDRLGRVAGWLDLWTRASAGTDAARFADIDARAPEDDDLVVLRSSSGLRFDQSFLQIMLRHHEDGAELADDVQERAESELVRELAAAVADEYLTDADRLRDMLAEPKRAPR